MSFLILKLESDGGSPILKLITTNSISSIMESYYLCDIWRLRNQNVKRLTWRQKTPLIQRRLGYFLFQMIFKNL